MGYICLEGGSEFGREMAAVDRRAMKLAGGTDAKICIIPTAAAVDNNQDRAGNNGRRWFERLGARNVEIVPIVDSRSADDVQIARPLEAARLIFMLGGSPDYLGKALRESAALRAMRNAHGAGAVVAGSSAGAMVLCSYYYNPHSGSMEPGFDFVPGTVCIPHFNRASTSWIDTIRAVLPDVAILGIDEYTGLIDDGDGKAGPNKLWTVYGGGTVTVLRPPQDSIDDAEVHSPGNVHQLHLE